MIGPSASAGHAVGMVLAAAGAGLAVFLMMLGDGGRGDRRRAGRPRRTGPGPNRPPARPAPRMLRAITSVIVVLTTAGLAVTIGPLVLLAVLGGMLAALVRIGHRRRRDRQQRIDDAAADLIDLFGIALAAGQPVPVALLTVAPRAPAVMRDELLLAARRFERGMLLATAMDGVRRLGPAHESLVDALLSAHRGGAPIHDVLGRLADSARDRRRRAAEVRARRLPVTMLFPLVLCTLPAFGLLAIVPLLVTSFADLA